MTTYCKPLWALTVLLCASSVVRAQDPVSAGIDVASERERIKVERSQMESEYGQSLKVCYQKLHVNNCKDEAFKIRLQKSNVLRSQERVLNEQERKQRSAAALQSIEDKNSPDNQTEAAERRARNAQQHLDKLQSNLDKNQERLEKEARESQNLEKNAQRELELSERQRAHNDKAQAARAEREKYLLKLQSSQEHREQVERNRVQRGLPGAASLPPNPSDKP
jgi:hypothetical protein